MTRFVPTQRLRIRVLSVDPSPRGFGYAVLEGSDRLVDWGIAQVWGKSEKELIARVEQLALRFEPHLLVIEDPLGSLRRERARRILAKLATHAKQRWLPVETVSRKELLAGFEATGTTKHQVAVAIAGKFPELALRLPRKRKPWMSEDERQNIFDAVAFALIALGRVEHGILQKS